MGGVPVEMLTANEICGETKLSAELSERPLFVLIFACKRGSHVPLSLRRRLQIANVIASGRIV